MTCPKCGEVLADNATTCSFCGAAVNADPQPNYNTPDPQPNYEPPVEEKPENVVAGTVGALTGALIGGVSIVVLMLLNFFAGLSGLIMAVCALKGYEILAGKLSKKGIVISIVFMVIVPLIAYFLGTAITVHNEWQKYGLVFSESVDMLLTIVKEDPETQAAVVKDLIMLYGFNALGAFTTITGAFKKKK